MCIVSYGGLSMVNVVRETERQSIVVGRCRPTKIYCEFQDFFLGIIYLVRSLRVQQLRESMSLDNSTLLNISIK